jgi:hypothetical protein
MITQPFSKIHRMALPERMRARQMKEEANFGLGNRLEWQGLFKRAGVNTPLCIGSVNASLKNKRGQ